jgi:predicted nucleic acid-binding Zn ribbon protein
MIPIQRFSSGVLGEILRRQPPSPGRTTLAWQLTVGPALARSTSVTLNGGVLVVRSTDVRWTQEITRARETVLTRLQNLLGPDNVRTLRIEK